MIRHSRVHPGPISETGASLGTSSDVLSSASTGCTTHETADARLTTQSSFTQFHCLVQDQVTFVEDSVIYLVDEVTGVLQTIAMVASLLSAWGLTIYAASSSETKCPSAPLAMITLLEWLALGFVFLCVSACIILILDLSGVPRPLLGRHLSRVWFICVVARAALIGGMICLAAGFVVDIGARIGCGAFLFGSIAAPGFVLLCVALSVGLSCARGALLMETPARSHHNAVTLAFAPFLVRVHSILSKEGKDDDTDVVGAHSLVLERHAVKANFGEGALRKTANEMP
jgi:hypothetical protein